MKTLDTQLFSATRAHGMERLRTVCAPAGHESDFAAAMLAPYIRHRLLTEDEVLSTLQAVLDEPAAQEIRDDLMSLRRDQDWLERRPALFRRYLDDRFDKEAELERDDDLRRRHDNAIAGETGISCFDKWAECAVQSGYLARSIRPMFASIWIFTLGLPWQLGVAFELRNLIAGEVADSLKLWRTVAGVEMGAAGYLVSVDEIEQAGWDVGEAFRTLARERSEPEPESEPKCLVRERVIYPDQGPDLRSVLILTSDDLNPESWNIEPGQVSGVLAVEPLDIYNWYGERVLAFKRAGLDDVLRRAQQYFDCATIRLTRATSFSGGSDGPIGQEANNDDVANWFDGIGARSLVAMAPAVGPGQDDVAAACAQLADARDAPTLHLLRRAFDVACLSEH